MNFIKYLVFSFAVGLSESTIGQGFGDFVSTLPEISHPKKFNEGSYVGWSDVALPPAYFSSTNFDSTQWKAVGKVLLDPAYPLILIRRYNADYKFHDSYMLVSFNRAGHQVAKLVAILSTDGEGATFAINPEKKIVVARYGASDAIIKTYNYVGGTFSQVPPVRYGEADNLGDY